jgi:hypothetical protein
LADVDSWRDKYRNNFTRGIIISAGIHCLLLLSLLLFPIINSPEAPRDYYTDTYTVNLTMVHLGSEAPGGGGSAGDGTEGSGGKASAYNTLNAVPVPTSEKTNIEFGKTTSISEMKDSLSRPGGSGMGSGTGKGAGDGAGDGYGFGKEIGSGFKQLPFMPRQTLEAVPQNTESVKGTIILVLRIGTDGLVKEHKVIFNSTSNKMCLNSTIEAAYKSRWEKIKMEGRQIEYWIEKSYLFN